MTFKEPVHRIVDWIKNESYFRWPNKMGGDPSKRDKGHTTNQCRVLKDHLGQLVKAGYWISEGVYDEFKEQGC